MGGNAAAVAGDEGADYLHGVHGMGYDKGQGMGGGENERGGGSVDAPEGEHFSEPQMGFERLGPGRRDMRELGSVGF